MSGKRVCIVAENHPLAIMGGAEYQTHLLAEELASRKDVKVTYLARRTPPVADHLPYAVRSIGSDRGFRRRAAFFDAPGLSRALSELKPHVIYQQMKQSYTAMCARYARRAGVPFYFHVASQGDLDGSWLSLRSSVNLPFDITESLLGDWGVRNATHVIVQSAAQQRLLLRNYRREADLLVRNFQPMPDSLGSLPAAPLRVLWVGNFKDVKRPQLFVELARMLAGDDRFRFEMVGRPAYLKRFDDLMSELKQIPNLRYHGELTVDQVNELMVESAFFVNTSSFEGFPNTFVQAWARGAVVLSLCVDPLDGMEQRDLGLCTGTVTRLGEALQSLAADAPRRTRMREAGFQYAHANHSLLEGARLADRMLA